VANIWRLMAGEEPEPMLSWWRGFKGTLKKTGDHKWTQSYKVELEAMIGEKGDGAVKVRAPARIWRCNDSGVELPAGL
jgi:DNA topoisomerase-2